jgi:hypothetical protein
MARVILRNTLWNQVTVQVRKGDYADPMQNTEWGEFTLTKTDNERIIPTTQSLHFRRESQPGSNNGKFSDWHHIPVYTNSEDITQQIS